MIKKQHWQNALDVQTACNLSGVVYSFAQAMEAICEEGRCTGKGTDWRNNHPIAVLFATQIAHLTKITPLADPDVWGRAYQEAKRMATDVVQTQTQS